nr:hypothetical protein [Veillonella parvula]DAK52262.1 MAG TPA: hypothetical protein [Caudoviricetes sp.]
MYVKVKQFTEKYPWSVPVIIILVCLSCVWLYANKSSNIDTTGIQRATTEVDNARQYNRRAVENNRRARTAIEHSQDVNDRIERTITRIDESNQRTEGAINRSQELIGAARANADNAKRIISESKRILRDADSRTPESKDATTE